MSAIARDSLSAADPTKSDRTPATLADYAGLDHTPRATDLTNSNLEDVGAVKSMSIKVEDGQDGTVTGFLHIPATAPKPNHGHAAILLSGAGGGVVGPSSMYLSIGDKIASLRNGIHVLRLDYRFPARNRYCIRDVLAAMDHLEETYKIDKFILVGWSFGGAPVFTVGGSDKRVIGCATVASQTAETDGIRSLAPRPVLLLHGKADKTLSPSCSERLYAMYGGKGEKRIHLFDGDDHALTRSALRAEEMLTDFIMECAGTKLAKDEREKVIQKELVGPEKRFDLMKKGGDLRGKESIQ